MHYGFAFKCPALRDEASYFIMLRSSSSHAANSFGLALFFGNMLKKEYKWFFILILFWASAVAYSRVYLGVHYPADIIGGAIFGGVCGWLVFTLFLIFRNYFYESKTNVAEQLPKL